MPEGNAPPEKRGQLCGLVRRSNQKAPPLCQSPFVLYGAVSPQATHPNSASSHGPTGVLGRLAVKLTDRQEQLRSTQFTSPILPAPGLPGKVAQQP